MGQKGFSPIIITLIVAVVALLGAGAYFAYSKGYISFNFSIPTKRPVPTAFPLETPSPKTPEPNPSAQEGTVSGRLCYPSDFLPPGEIVAKNLTTLKTVTQSYVGSTAGGASTYSLKLSPGMYHLRYQAHASLTKPDIFTSGYYDDCAKSGAGVDCTPDSGHVIINVTVTAGQETKNVDLCDFYYNPAQMQSLDSSF